MAKRMQQEPGSHLPLQPNDFEILLSLSEGEKHGYRIIRDIEERTKGMVSLGTSTLYASIRRMLAAGILKDGGNRPKEASGGPPRRYYKLTAMGRRVLKMEAIRLQEVAAAARERILGLERGN